VAPGYTWYAGTLRDGRLTTKLPTLSQSWTAVLDDAGTLAPVLTLSDPDIAKLNLYLNAEPCRCFAAVAYTDEQGTETFLEGGPIWTHGYDDETQRLTIGAAGLWSLWDHRKILPVLSAGQSAAAVTTSYTTAFGTIAKRLVQLAQSHVAGSVPVVLPSDEGGTQKRVYAGSELGWVGQALRDLTTVDGGPEIAFVPRRQATDGRYLEWVMRVGTAAQPLLVQAGQDWRWDQTAARSSLGGISVNRDGSLMGSRAWDKGNGSDTAMLIAQADSTVLTDIGFPLLEVEGSGQEAITDTAVLAGFARGLLTAAARPKETWTVKVRRDGNPNAGATGIGDWATIIVKPDSYLPAGPYRSRILSKSGDDSLDVTMQMSPTLGGI
jgi:hypothetical protein